MLEEINKLIACLLLILITNVFLIIILLILLLKKFPAIEAVALYLLLYVFVCTVRLCMCAYNIPW